MKWLVTTKLGLDAAGLDAALERVDAHRVEKQDAIPLGSTELVWEVEGPPNLDHRLHGVEAVEEVYPSSSFTLE